MCGDEDNSNIIINAWFGPAGTVSPCHHDPYNNLLAQVIGCKYIRLFSHSESMFLYPHDGIMSNTSQVATFIMYATHAYTDTHLRMT